MSTTKNHTLKITKNLLFSALLLLFFWLPASAREGFAGEKTLGLGVGFNSYNSSAVASVEFTYRFSRNFRLAPSADYVFRREGADALQLNVDAQFPLPVFRGIAVYPFAGLNYSNWNLHPGLHATSDASTRVGRFGANVGMGVDFTLTRSLRLGVDCRYTIIKRFDSATAMARIAYIF